MSFGVGVAWVWLATGLALGLVLLGSWGASRRRRSLVLWPLAIASLWCLAVRPELPLPAGGPAPALTLATDDWQGGAGSVALRWPETEQVHVRGHGLRAFDWRGSRLEILSFEPPPVPRGLVFAHWTRALPLGADLTVRGTATETVDGIEVRLVGPAGVEARAPVAGGRFTLSARPRTVGPVLYALEGGPEEGPAWRESLDVEVLPERLPRVLWIEGAPSAESATFRRWLERRGGSIAMRSRPSRGRVRTALAGFEEPPVLRELDAATLADFDVAVLAPGGLSGVELERLRAAVEAGTLGVVWRGRDEGFEIAPIPGLDSLAARVRPGGGEPSEPLSIAPREIRASPRAQPVLVDSAGRILAARRLVGAGWSALSLLEGTYRWPLAGHPDDYARVWSALLEAATPTASAAGWRLPSGPLLVDQPIDLTLDGESLESWVEEPSGARVPLDPLSDDLEPARAHFTYWPRESGWHLAKAGASSAWFYAQDRSTAWIPWQAARRQEDTRAYAAQSRARPSAAGPRPWSRRPLPRLVLFALLFASLTALWSRERFGSAVRLAGAR